MGLFRKDVGLVNVTSADVAPGGTADIGWYYGYRPDGQAPNFWVVTVNVNQSWSEAAATAGDIYPGSVVFFEGAGQDIQIGQAGGGVRSTLDDAPELVDAITKGARPQAVVVCGEWWMGGQRRSLVLALVGAKVRLNIPDHLPAATTVVPKPPSPEAEAAKQAAKERKAAATRLARKFPLAGKIAKAALGSRISVAQAEELLGVLDELEFEDSAQLAEVGFDVPDPEGDAWQYALNDLRVPLESLIDAEDADERQDESDMAIGYAEDLFAYFIDREGLDT